MTNENKQIFPVRWRAQTLKDDIILLRVYDKENKMYDINFPLKHIVQINKILKELSSSDLIYEISYKEIDNHFTLTIIEGDIVENIYINNNVWVKDDLIIQNLRSKNKSFLLFLLFMFYLWLLGYYQYIILLECFN